LIHVKRIAGLRLSQRRPQEAFGYAPHVNGATRQEGPLVAIDGPAGSGKSTLARRVALEMGLPYVNTGLMYRVLARRALDSRLDLEDGPGLRALVERMRFELGPDRRLPALLVDGDPPGDEVIDPDVEAAVSVVARHPEVRILMAERQRVLGGSGAVMEGRDIGSVVFPAADVKIFLDAAPDERAGRRVRERAGASGVADDLALRDARDSRVNPFVPAPDAVRLDTTGRDPDAVFDEAMRIIRTRLGEG
jgi:CMP/dCMP kinase